MGDNLPVIPAYFEITAKIKVNVSFYFFKKMQFVVCLYSLHNIMLKNYYTLSFLNSKTIAVFAFIILYIALAKASFLVAIMPGNISPVFPAAGFALACVHIYGYHMLIGLWIGSFIANTCSIYYISAFSDESLNTILVSGFFIATGASLASGTAVLLIKYLNKKSYPLSSTSTVLVFTGACLLSAFISAAFGVVSMSLIFDNEHLFWLKFWTWTIGDAIGAIIIGAFMLSWMYSRHYPRKISSFSKKGFGVILAITVGLFFIFDNINSKYLSIFAMILWFAIYFGSRGVATFALLVLISATIFTSLGHGPYVIYDSNESLLLMDTLLGIGTVIGLLLAGLIAEEKRKNSWVFSF